MKHLFYIHSYITYHVSLEVIRHHGLQLTDCIFLYGRSFRPESLTRDVQHIDLPFSHHPVNSFAVERKFWGGWGKLARFDRFLSNLVNRENFKLYTNQSGIDFIRLFISHEQCAGFSFLEEGVASYYSLHRINTVICPAGSSTLFFKALLQLNFLGRLSPQKWFYASGYEHVYGITPESFPGFERKITLPFPFKNNLPLPRYEHVLVLDATAEYGVALLSSILAGLETGLQYLLANGVRKLWVKYHPDQANTAHGKQPYERVFEKFSGLLRLEEVPQEVSLEFVAGNKGNQDTVFYIFLSSLGLYAGKCGREVYSLAPFVSVQDRDYAQRVQRLPDAFKDNVRFLRAAPI